jgi:hypothetical protein
MLTLSTHLSGISGRGEAGSYFHAFEGAGGHLLPVGDELWRRGDSHAVIGVLTERDADIQHRASHGEADWEYEAQ